MKRTINGQTVTLSSEYFKRELKSLDFKLQVLNWVLVIAAEFYGYLILNS